MTTNTKVTIYTDGSCIGNPGPGGYAAVLLHGGHRKEISGGFQLTTNNRMELLAAIVCLQTLEGRCSVSLYSDSKYVVDAMSKGWAQRWKANGWKRNKTENALNPDLWEQLLSMCGYHDVEFRWVRGHAGNVENERCDELAVRAASETNLPNDNGYESGPANG